MRHGKKFNHLGRKAGHRKAMLANLAISLIEHKRIKTTLAKAKALRKYVEPMITRSKNDTTHNRRVVFSSLQNKEAIKELFGDISTTIGERPGGYTRILKIGTRLGDAAEMAIIELVDYNQDLLSAPKEAKKKTRRSRSRKKNTENTDAAVATETVVAENAAEQVADVAEVETVQEVVQEQVAEVTDVAEETVAEVADTAEEAADEVAKEEPKAEDENTEDA